MEYNKFERQLQIQKYNSIIYLILNAKETKFVHIPVLKKNITTSFFQKQNWFERIEF